MKFYISSDGLHTDSIPLNLGVKFTIKNKRWATPLVITFDKILGDDLFKPVMLKRIAPPSFSINDVDLKLVYNGYLDGTPNVTDDAPERKDGIVPTNAKNYNRLWTLSIGFKSTTSTNFIARGWRNLDDATENGKFLSSQNVTAVGKRSIGIYHNEFLLCPIGAFVDGTMQKATRVEKFIGKETLCNYQTMYIYDVLNENSSSLIKIYIGASFLGKSQTLEYFPPLNLAFYDQYGNSYNFSLDLKSLKMRYGKLSSDPDINLNSLFNLELNGSGPQKENPKPEPYYLFSTTADDHTILADFSSSNNKGSVWRSKYGSPNTVSRLKIVGLNGGVFSQNTLDMQKSFFLLCYYDQPKDAQGSYVYLSRNYTSNPVPPNGNGDQVAAAYIGIEQHFYFNLLPVWGGGKICFIMNPESTTNNDDHYKKYLSILDNVTDPFTKKGDGSGVYFSNYYDEFSIFSMNVFDKDSKDNQNN